MSKFTKIAAGLAVVPMLAFSAPALAAGSPGNLEGGPVVYKVKNLTQSGSYADSATIKACGDELQYSIDIHNTEFGKLSDVNVKAALQSNGSSSFTASATNAAGAQTTTDGSVTVSGLASNETLAYETGSTQLYTNHNQTVAPQSDNLFTSGLNLGDLAGSTGEFVNFKAKVTCTTTPPVTPPTTPKPTVLVNTGAGSVVGIFAAVSAVSALGYRLVLGRRLSRSAK